MSENPTVREVTKGLVSPPKFGPATLKLGSLAGIKER